MVKNINKLGALLAASGTLAVGFIVKKAEEPVHIGSSLARQMEAKGIKSEQSLSNENILDFDNDGVDSNKTTYNSETICMTPRARQVFDNLYNFYKNTVETEGKYSLDQYKCADDLWNVANMLSKREYNTILANIMLAGSEQINSRLAAAGLCYGGDKLVFTANREVRVGADIFFKGMPTNEVLGLKEDLRPLWAGNGFDHPETPENITALRKAVKEQLAWKKEQGRIDEILGDLPAWRARITGQAEEEHIVMAASNFSR